MEARSTAVETTAAQIAGIADALREEMHESVARACRPALLELTRLHKGTRISVVRSPRMPTALICVPALLSDDFHPESDLVKWLAHSGHGGVRRAEIVEHVMTILSAVSTIDTCGLAPATFSLENEEDYDGEDEDREDPELATVVEDGAERGSRIVSIHVTGHDGARLRLSDSSLAYPDAVRLSVEGGSPLLTRGHVASLMPALMRFLRTGSVLPTALR